MKFAHQYQDTLTTEDFPVEWIKSAISYRQLKKCIKEVQRELASIGLDHATLTRLLEAVEEVPPQADDPRAREVSLPFHYDFAGDHSIPHPRLVFVVSTCNGVPFNATLSSETKTYLHGLAASQQQASLQATTSATTPSDDRAPGLEEQRGEGDSGDDNVSHPLDGSDQLPQTTQHPSVSIEHIEIPLRSDSEFFHLLRDQVSALDTLQEREEVQATEEVADIGQIISTVVAPSANTSRTDLYQWRDVLALYLQAKIFFSTNEQDGESRTAIEATNQLTWFSGQARHRSLLKHFKRKESRMAFEKFVRINAILLRNLKFQEINRLAMSKILKKFDKRTALGAKGKFPALMSRDLFLERTMAKAICFKISEHVLARVPQLSDHLCPICFTISYKPVRLTCGHTFCIRCMITMQRAKAKNCPLCRGDVVMEADSANLDPSFMGFLETYFPREVKAKQRDNERAVAVDKWGEAYVRCLVM